MKIADHLEKFERLDAARESLDQAEDAELWFWTTVTAAMQAMNAALHAVGCTEERNDFLCQIMGVYERLSEDEKTFLLIHESPLTDALFLLVSKSDEVTTT